MPTIKSNTRSISSRRHRWQESRPHQYQSSSTPQWALLVAWWPLPSSASRSWMRISVTTRGIKDSSPQCIVMAFWALIPFNMWTPSCSVQHIANMNHLGLYTVVRCEIMKRKIKLDIHNGNHRQIETSEVLLISLNAGHMCLSTQTSQSSADWDLVSPAK